MHPTVVGGEFQLAKRVAYGACAGPEAEVVGVGVAVVGHRVAREVEQCDVGEPAHRSLIVAHRPLVVPFLGGGKEGTYQQGKKELVAYLLHVVLDKGQRCPFLERTPLDTNVLMSMLDGKPDRCILPIERCQKVNSCG